MNIAPRFPMTPRQSLFAVDDKIHPGLPANHVLTRLSIHGTVDPGRMQRAFADLVKRHEALRTELPATHSIAQVQVLAEAHSNLEVLDFSDFEAPNAAYESWLRQFCLTVFAPGRPLYRAALVKTSPDQHCFLLNQHHIITDSQSCILLHSELSQLYLDNDTPQPTQLGNGAASFSHFLTQSKNAAHSNDGRASEAYWAHRLQPPPDLVRPYGFPPKTHRVLTRRATHRLDSRTSRMIRSLRPDIPHSVFFATVAFAYLRRISPSDDLCVGIPLLNRLPQFRGTIGLLMEVVPNRIHFDPNESLASLLQKVRSEIASVKPHRSHTITARRAGYNVILNVHDKSPATFAQFPADYELTTPLNLLTALEGEETTEEAGSGRESLAIQVHHSSEEFEVSFDFNVGVWPSADARGRAIAHFLRMIELFFTQFDTPIDALDLLTEFERSVLIPRSATRSVKLPTAAEWFSEQAIRTPQAVAMRHLDAVMTYGELDRRVKALASQLRSLGVGADVLVGVFLERSFGMVIALLATMRAGGAYVPIDPRYPGERIAMILEDADPRVLLSDSTMLKKLNPIHADRALCLDTLPELEYAEDKPVAVGDLAYVIFTSGSTGRPKGVMVRHHGLSTFLQAMARQPGLTAADRLLAVTTISFDIAALEIFLPLITGASVSIAPYEASIDAKALIALISRDKITTLQATPATFRMLIAGGWQPPPTLRILCGGEALQPDLAEQLLSRSPSVWNMYGPTETTIWSSTKQLREGETKITLGVAIDGTRFYVLNDHMQPVPLGVPGELCIAGDGVAAGYLKQDKLTSLRFIADPYSSDSNQRMYRTGDLVRMLENIEPEFLGRSDFQIKIRGFRIELGEIEAVLNGLEVVRECVVTAHRDSAGVDFLAAYVVAAEGARLSGKEIRQHVRERLPPYMVPSAVVQLKGLPLTPAGKIDRKALPEPSHNEKEEDSGGFVAPNVRNRLEHGVALVWSRVLGLEKIGVNDNFFDLGGDSISAVFLANEVENATGLQVDLGRFFSNPTIRHMVDDLQSSFSQHGWSLVPLRADGGGNPLFCLAGIYVYQKLAAALGPKCPVYGIYVSEERAIISGDARDGRSASIERWATAYRDAILHQQPNGPYQLAGLSIGGVLALETARMLRECGKEVRLVVLLDTILPSAILRNRAIWLGWHLKQALTKGPGPYLRRLFKRSTKKTAEVIAVQSGEKFDQVLRRELAFIEAIKNFESQIKPYAGDVVLMRSMDHSRYGPGTRVRRDYGWGSRLTGRFSICDVPGDHISIVEASHVQQLADALGPLLE